MTKLCTSDTTKLLFALLLHDLIYCCSFLASHPLYMAYMLFFSPCLLQLLSFLSPLLLSTLLLLLVFLTVSPFMEEPLPSPFEFLGNACSIVLRILKENLERDENVGLLEQYVMMVLEPMIAPPISCCQHTSGLASVDDFCNYASSDCHEEESPIMLSLEEAKEHQSLVSTAEIASRMLGTEVEENRIHLVPKDSSVEGETLASDSLSKNEDSENLGLEKRIPKIRDVLHSEDKAAEQEQQSALLPSSDDNVGETLAKSASIRRKKSTEGVSQSLQRDASMRKEKEWKRTLACKLYEERMTFKLCEDQQVADGEEQMDLLWEAYEVNASKIDNFRSKEKKGKKPELKQQQQQQQQEEEEEEESDEEEDEEEGTTGQLCCLQALRFSTGKMKLGVVRPNMVKISKVLKGMAMFRIGSHSSRKG